MTTGSNSRTVTFESSDGSTVYFRIGLTANNLPHTFPPFYAAEGLRVRKDVAAGGSDVIIVLSYFQD